VAVSIDHVGFAPGATTVSAQVTNKTASTLTIGFFDANNNPTTDEGQIDIVAERPILLEEPNNLFVCLGEANLVDFARMKFELKENSTLKSKLNSRVTFNKPFVTPWRYIMAAAKPGRLLEHNYLVLNLSDPNKIEDTSWIRPGKVIREVTLTTQGGMACVDFAAKYNLQFVEFDAGWYGPEYDTLSDATTISVDPKRSKGPLDLHKVIAYAKSKNIGIILYVNRRALERQLDEILPLYQSWGIDGVKYGFVNVGSQYWTAWLHEAVRKAAEYELMVDIHDEYRPTGYSRTYPNLMTQEGIRGDEESPDNAMVLNTLFTRMLTGAGDHTNCYMASRVDEKMRSHASQMAKTICVYSPWQFVFWYDRPQGSPTKKGGAGGAEGFIPEIDDLQFYDQVPTVWDETKVLDGYPGKSAVVARRSGESWYVGVLNGKQKKHYEIKLGFLEAGKIYSARIFSDDPVIGTMTNVKITTQEVNSKSVLSQEIMEMNGVALIIDPV
jgi:alpha-glucosidase